MTINMNILNYDGSQIKRKYKINTSTGEFETLGYNVIEISLDQDYIELGVGESSKLTAIILPTNATNKEIKSSFVPACLILASANALLKFSSGLLSDSDFKTSATEISSITFIPPFRSSPRPISISRHCLNVYPNQIFSLDMESR